MHASPKSPLSRLRLCYLSSTPTTLGPKHLSRIPQDSDKRSNTQHSRSDPRSISPKTPSLPHYLLHHAPSLPSFLCGLATVSILLPHILATLPISQPRSLAIARLARRSVSVTGSNTVSFSFALPTHPPDVEGPRPLLSLRQIRS